MRFLPAGETALLVSDAPRRCGDVPALLDGCRAAGFDARERDGLLLLTPTEALRALDVPARIDVDWDAPDAPTAAFAAYLMRRADRPLTEDGLRLVVKPCACSGRMKRTCARVCPRCAPERRPACA